MTIGEQMKQARKKAGLTQAQLAEQLGVATITIRQYELGKREPRMEQLLRLSGLLHTDFRIGFQDIPSMEKCLAQVAPEATGKAEFTVYYAGDDARTLAETQAFAQRTADRQHLNMTVMSMSARLNKAFDRLNTAGQRVAIERLEELAEIPKYQRESEAGQNA